MTTATATELKTFNFQTNAIRIIDRDGQPWFVANDVCRAICLSAMKNGQPNVTDACRRLADDERGLSSIETPIPTKADHRTNMKVVSESGLYKLIMRSDKPEAVAFQERVTRVVLPAIRKTGGYMLAGADQASIFNPISRHLVDRACPPLDIGHIDLGDPFGVRVVLNSP
jgi:prophage antirepressor-like protein